MFRVDDPLSEPGVLHELTQKKMAEDAKSDIAIRFVDENDYREISAKAVSAKRKLKRIALPLLYRANSKAGKSLTHWIFSHGPHNLQFEDSNF